MLPVPTRDELTTFTGRPAGTFGPYATEALAQATLMFSVVTHLSAYPDDPDQSQLAKNAILEMADRLIMEQPWQAYKGNPFQSETIGSYTYSKVTAVTKTVQSGGRTGLFWWDLAVDELTVPGASSLGYGSVAIDTPGLNRLNDGTLYVAGPAEGDESSPPYTRIS